MSRVLPKKNCQNYCKYYGVLPPLSANLAPYIERLERVSVYEILQPITLAQTPEADLFYKYKVSNSEPYPFGQKTDTTVNNRNIDSLLFRIASRGIPIDTAWFQEGIQDCTTGGCGRYPLGGPPPFSNGFNLVIKLRKHNERINEFGKWIRGYPRWRYGDLATPRRYVFRVQPTGVSVAHQSSALRFALAPNPAGNEGAILSCVLPRSSILHIEVFTVLGSCVVRLENQALAEGEHTIALPLAGSSPGLYQVRIRYTLDGVEKVTSLPLLKL